MRFKEKDATVRYEVGKVKLEQILKQYDATPFGVTPAGPIVTVARTKQMTLRGWTQKATAKPNEAKASEQNAPEPIQLFVEFIPVEESQIVDTPDLSLSDPPASGLEVLQPFKKVEGDQKPRNEKTELTRFVARLYETVALQPGEIAVPVSFKFSTTDVSDAKHDAEGKLNVVLRTVRKIPTVADVAGSGVALIDGRLELRLGHLCDQKGCVTHFHKSLGEITGLAAVHAR
ncbi:MAG: hypothetical protein IH991_10045, partial [Planctomycetes bacterium]|nr:hypothetical protein [Planctomycetota bacterium]